MFDTQATVTLSAAGDLTSFQVRAVSDGLAEDSPHTEILVHFITSETTKYNGLQIDTVTTSISDSNAAPQITGLASDSVANASFPQDSFVMGTLVNTEVTDTLVASDPDGGVIDLFRNEQF